MTSGEQSRQTRRTVLRSGVAAAILAALERPVRAFAIDRRPPKAHRPPKMPGTAEIFSWIKDLCAHGNRRTGTAADRRSETYLVRRLRQFGVADVHVQHTRSRRWEATHWELKVNGHAIDSFPSSWSFVRHGHLGSFSTGTKGLSAPLVDVGDGNAADFKLNDVKGRIVLFNVRFLLPRAALLAASEWYYDPGLTTTPSDATGANPYITNFDDVLSLAQQNGAVGFIGVLADYWNSNKYFTECDPVQIPGHWVSPQEGARIRSLTGSSGSGLSASRSATAHLRLDGKTVRATAGTVIGVLPGRSKQTVMIQSHHDSVWAGGVEDASGSAEVLALAKYFGQFPRAHRPKTLMFVLMDSHFTGYQAHRKFVRTHIKNPHARYRIVANVTIEHIAREAEKDADGSLRVLDQPEYRGVFENVSDPIKQSIKNAITRHKLVRTAMLSTDELFPVLGELPTDADYVYRAGVPTISFISGPLYLYDKADTPDKVYKHDLVPVAKAFAEIVEKLAATPSAKIGK